MGKFMGVLVENILSTLGPEGRMVTIDGVDGSGKTSFTASWQRRFITVPW
jgi:tRNA A37 threonylcarbamoyladenosine biosynthesis protein TsaE